MLSRWVRDRIVDVPNFDSLDEGLGAFVQERTQHSEGYTDREMAKLRSGSGLNSNKGFHASGATASADRTPKKRPREVCMFLTI